MLKQGMIGVFLLALSIWDVRKRAVPSVVLWIGMTVAICFCLADLVTGNVQAAFCLRLLPGIGMLLIAICTKKAGSADGMVLLMLGMLLGFYACVLVWWGSLCLMAVASMVLLGFKKVKRDSRLPYLPFLGVVYLFCLLRGSF